MGKTTSGQGTSENWHSWSDTYNRFSKMFNNKTGSKPFLLTDLYDQITQQQPDPVAGALRYLDSYYREIESFLNDARSPNGATSKGKEELAETVEDLSDTGALYDYGITVMRVLFLLDSIAQKAKDYINSISSSTQLSAEERSALTNLLTTIKSISENVIRDFAAEVRGDWVGYKSARRQSLNAIAGIPDDFPQHQD